MERIVQEDDLSWMKLEDDTPGADVKRSTVNKKRSKLIMLDDLLREREKKKSQQSRKRRVLEPDDSSSGTDDDETADEKAQIVKRMLKDLENDSTAVDEKVSLLKWGEDVFYSQTPISRPITTSEDCLGSSTEMTFSMEGLVLSGMLRSLAISEGRCDEKTTRWVYLQMVQSPNELLEKAACQFLCDLFILQRSDGNLLCRFEWFPTSMEIMDVFRSYGYRKAPVTKDGKSVDTTGRSCIGGMTVCHSTSDSDQIEGPPPNIRSFVAFLITLFQTRHLHQTLSPSEAEELVITLAHCQMDRRVESISPTFRSCLKASVHYFTDEEWAQSCPRIASSFSSMSSNPLNQVRAAKSLNAGDSRLCSLQRLVVILLLGKSMKKEMKNAADVVSIFKPINMKKNDFDFLNLFHQLTSADLYLWSEPGFERNRSAHNDWLEFLKKITLSISSSDERPHATKAFDLIDSKLSKSWDTESEAVEMFRHATGRHSSTKSISSREEHNRYTSHRSRQVFSSV